MNKKFFSVNLSPADWQFIQSVLSDYSDQLRKKQLRFAVKTGKVFPVIIEKYVRVESLSESIFLQSQIFGND